MKNVIKNNWSFFIPFAVVWLLVLGIVLGTTKLEQMQFINAHNSLWADYFFLGATEWGEGWFFFAVILVHIIFVRFDRAMMFAVSLALSTLISSTSKLWFNTLRPIGFFEGLNHQWHLIKDLPINIHLSFPSGHTTTAFAVFTMLMLLNSYKKMGFIFVLLAWLTGYSRCYLFQHFPEDVLGGAVIGSMSSLSVYVFFLNLYLKNPRQWHEKNIFNLRKAKK
jgi:membrane-associated phospholipid phosphatase